MADHSTKREAAEKAAEKAKIYLNKNVFELIRHAIFPFGCSQNGFKVVWTFFVVPQIG